MSDELEHRRVWAALGPYVLGDADPGEQGLVVDHLATCSGCRLEVDALRRVADLLSDVDPAGLQDDAAPSPAARARALGATRGVSPRGLAPRGLAPLRTAARPPRRRLVPAVAAAAVLVAGVSGVLAGRASAPEPARAPLEPVALQTEAAGVTGSGSVIDHTWGLEVRMVLTGLQDGADYTVQITDGAGRPVDAGGFIGTGDRPLACNLNVALLRDAATGFAVLGPGGEVVITAEL